MGVSVFLSGDSIKIAEGHPIKKGMKIKKLISIQMPVDAMINGVVTNEDEIKDIMGRIWAEHKVPRDDIRIVIDSSSLLLKVLTVPLVKENNIYSIIKREFSDVENYEDMLFDYAVQQPSLETGGGQVLAFAADRQFIGSYIELFKGLKGSKITRITAAQESTVRFMRMCREMEGKTYITAVIDGNILSLMLFSDNKYKFSNRSRLLCDKGTPEYADEIAYAISSIIQFNRAEISDVYFFGVNKDDWRTLNSIDQMLERQSPIVFPYMSDMIKMKKPPYGSSELTDFIYCIGCL